MTWSLSKQPGCNEAERKVRGQGGRGKIAAGVAKPTIDCCRGLQFGFFILTPAKPCIKLYVPHPASGQNSIPFPSREQKYAKRTQFIPFLAQKQRS